MKFWCSKKRSIFLCLSLHHSGEGGWYQFLFWEKLLQFMCISDSCRSFGEEKCFPFLLTRRRHFSLSHQGILVMTYHPDQGRWEGVRGRAREGDRQTDREPEEGGGQRLRRRAGGGQKSIKALLFTSCNPSWARGRTGAGTKLQRVVRRFCMSPIHWSVLSIQNAVLHLHLLASKGCFKAHPKWQLFYKTLHDLSPPSGSLLASFLNIYYILSHTKLSLFPSNFPHPPHITLEDS